MRIEHFGPNQIRTLLTYLINDVLNVRGAPISYIETPRIAVNEDDTVVVEDSQWKFTIYKQGGMWHSIMEDKVRKDLDTSDVHKNPFYIARNIIGRYASRAVDMWVSYHYDCTA